MILTSEQRAELRVALADGSAHERMVEALKAEHGKWTAEQGFQLLEARLEAERLADGKVGA